MGVSQSNLSDYAKFGIDLVVAVTQASVNATLMQLVDGLQAPEVTLCYVYDIDGNLIPVDYRKLVEDAKGADPFTVPDGANPATDPRLANLSNAGFAGAVRAKLGLPDLPIESLPPIATLGSGSNAPVLFNLLCAEFQITGFALARGRIIWIDQSQPSGPGSTPWLYSAAISLNTADVPYVPHGAAATAVDTSLPEAVRERAEQLRQSYPGSAFTIQKLFLDLDTAITRSNPVMIGVPQNWPVAGLINQVFLGAYFAQLRKSGDPVLAYNFTLPKVRATTLQLGAVSRECQALLDQNGKPINQPTPAQRNAATLIYLGNRESKPPAAVPFSWNWVELGDVTAYSGVQAVRRDVFFGWLAAMINPQLKPLCIEPHVYLHHVGGDFDTPSYWTTPSSAPATLSPVTQIGPPDQYGFADALMVEFDRYSYDDSENDIHSVEISSNFNYYLTCRVATNGDQLRTTLRATVLMDFKHREYMAHYTDLKPNNYYDNTVTCLYTLSAGLDGALTVDEDRSEASNSAPLEFDAKGLSGFLHRTDFIEKALHAVNTQLSGQLDGALRDTAKAISTTINGYGAWVFPGNDAFIFKNVAFSDSQDLTTRLTYANPRLNAAMAAATEV